MTRKRKDGKLLGTHESDKHGVWGLMRKEEGIPARKKRKVAA